MLYLIKAQAPCQHLQYKDWDSTVAFSCHCVSSLWTSHTCLQSRGAPLPEYVFPRILLRLLLGNCLLLHAYLQSGFPPAATLQDLIHLVPYAHAGSLSARVQVAHAGEGWPGSGVASPVAICCWQFTQAPFSTSPGRISTPFPFSEGSISWPLG